MADCGSHSLPRILILDPKRYRIVIPVAPYLKSKACYPSLDPLDIVATLGPGCSKADWRPRSNQRFKKVNRGFQFAH